VLAELERLVGELRSKLRSGGGAAIGALLNTIHDAVRGLRTELDLPVSSTWGRTLGTQRTLISDLLKSKIESTPGRMQRLLHVRPASDVCVISVLGEDDVAEAEVLIEFTCVCACAQ
jgi:hypothetical protein